MIGMHPAAVWVDEVIAEASEAHTLVFRAKSDRVSLSRFSGDDFLETEEREEGAAQVRGRLFVLAGLDLLRIERGQGVFRPLPAGERSRPAELIYVPAADGWTCVVNVGKDPNGRRPEAQAFFGHYQDFYIAYIVSGCEANHSYRQTLIDHLVCHPESVGRHVTVQLLREEALSCQESHGVSQAFLDLSDSVAAHDPDLFAEMAPSLCLSCFDVYMALRSLSLPENTVEALRRKRALRGTELGAEAEADKEIQLLAELISAQT